MDRRKALVHRANPGRSADLLTITEGPSQTAARSKLSDGVPEASNPALQPAPPFPEPCVSVRSMSLSPDMAVGVDAGEASFSGRVHGTCATFPGYFSPPRAESMGVVCAGCESFVSHFAGCCEDHGLKPGAAALLDSLARAYAVCRLTTSLISTLSP